MTHDLITPCADGLVGGTVGAADVARLGTVLGVWAHPDDEAYLSGALLAALAAVDRPAVCVTATRGEAADPDAGARARAALAAVRTRELEDALAILGVSDHHWLDLPDGGCAEVDAAGPVARIRAVLDQVQPDTVLTFGPDGVTGHPDHRAVSRWVDLALDQAGGDVRLLHPVETPATAQRDRELDEDFGVYELGRPRIVTPEEVVVHLVPDDALLDRKVAALRAQASQTSGLIDAVGIERFRRWVSVEVFAAPAR